MLREEQKVEEREARALAAALQTLRKAAFDLEDAQVALDGQPEQDALGRVLADLDDVADAIEYRLPAPGAK